MPKEPLTIISGEHTFFACKVDGMEHGFVARVVRGEETLILARVFIPVVQKLVGSLASLQSDRFLERRLRGVPGVQHVKYQPYIDLLARRDRQIFELIMLFFDYFDNLLE